MEIFGKISECLGAERPYDHQGNGVSYPNN